MKIICPTCNTLGTIKKRFVYYLMKRGHQWLKVSGDHSPYYYNTDDSDSTDKCKDPDTHQEFTAMSWPRIKCQTCNGEGWVDRVDNVLEATVK